MSRHVRLAGQGGRYLAVGIYNVGFTLAVFWLLDTFLGETLGVQAVYWISAGLGIINGFIFQRLVVWRSRGMWRRELAKFAVVNLAVSLINSFLLFLTVTLWGLPAFPSQVGITAVLLIATFIVNRQWVFRATQPSAREEKDR
ncbi:GtrA family protein [Microbacterium sp. BR1]|uniref:GtrA family protein n=1 Tax=Microbacterium sp. BR1 TaxID=1070896 RepID=UPI000C2BAFB8|nr:GtrA family protein [Microbacterium sp. BR1]